MKKFICSVLIIISTLLVGNVYAETGELNNSEGIKFTYYYGDGCSHCATLDRYLERNDIYELLNIEKKEVWGDKENNDEMLAMCQRLGINESSIGVPLFVVENGGEELALVGETDIISYIKPYLGETVLNDSSRKTIVLVILGVLAVGVPTIIITLMNRKGVK